MASKYCNYHMHTTFCDGRDTAEAMAAESFALGCPEVGFSGHSYLSFDPDWTMAPDTMERYIRTVNTLKQEYAGRMNLLLGLELDYCSEDIDTSSLDYVIGGVHCVFKDDHYISVDLGLQELLEGVRTWYNGDMYAFAEDYYASVGDLYDKTHCDIIAHFDLITKFIEQNRYLDPEDPRYVKAVDNALDRLLAAPVVFEINTGAISRGYRTTPYPDPYILKRLGESGTPVLLSSDAHCTSDLLYAFPETEELCGQYGLNLFRTLGEAKASL